MSTSSGSNKPTKTTRIASDVQLTAGLKEHYAETDSLPFAVPPVTVAQILALLVARGDATHATAAAHGAWRNAVNAEKQNFTDSERVLRALRTWLRTVHGEDTKLLADFGLTPKKAPRVLTAEEKQAAAAKRAATRKARGVLGSRQRKKVVAPQTPAGPPPTPPTPPTPPKG
jgi:hypothetical protein